MDTGVDPITDRAQLQRLSGCQTAGDGAEHVADLGTEQKQDRDNDYGNQYENQRILYQTLTFFAWQIHFSHPLSTLFY
jgi:hypothetical protein